MNLSVSNLISWAPTQHERIFAVLVPATTDLLTAETYWQHLTQRVRWLIQQWLDYQETNQEQTQQMLHYYLKQFYPIATPTPVAATIDRSLWLQAWEQQIVLNNEMLKHSLDMLDISWPVSIDLHPQRQQWLLGMFKKDDPQPNLEEWLQEAAAPTLL